VRHYLQLYSGTDYAKYLYGSQLFNKTNVFKSNRLLLNVALWKPGHNTRLHNHPSDAYYKVLSGQLFDYGCEYSITDDKFRTGPPRLDILEEGAVQHVPRNWVHMVSTYEQTISIHVQLLEPTCSSTAA